MSNAVAVPPMPNASGTNRPITGKVTTLTKAPRMTGGVTRVDWLCRGASVLDFVLIGACACVGGNGYATLLKAMERPDFLEREYETGALDVVGRGSGAPLEAGVRSGSLGKLGRVTWKTWKDIRPF